MLSRLARPAAALRRGLATTAQVRHTAGTLGPRTPLPRRAGVQPGPSSVRGRTGPAGGLRRGVGREGDEEQSL